MPGDNFKPIIWAGEILAAYKTRHVYGLVANSDYEGEIRAAGDTVLINSVSDPTVRAYTGVDIASPDEPNGGQIPLLIDQADYVNFMVDKVDEVQGKPDRLREIASRAAFRMAQAADLYMAGKYTLVGAANLVGTDGSPIVPTADTLYEYLIDMGVILDENDVPEDGRFVVLPPWCRGLLQKDDRFANFGTDANHAFVRGTPVKMIDRMAVYISNNVPNTTGTLYKIIAGHPDAWTFANQLPADSLTTYTPEKRFGSAMKGLHLYGGQVIRPYALAVATFNKV